LDCILEGASVFGLIGRSSDCNFYLPRSFAPVSIDSLVETPTAVGPELRPVVCMSDGQ
jgi:hypothetical protein